PWAWAGAKVARAVGGTWSVLLVGGSSSMAVGGAHGSVRPRPPCLVSPAAVASTISNPQSPSSASPAVLIPPPFVCCLGVVLGPSQRCACPLSALCLPSLSAVLALSALCLSSQ
ncbi:hypothetical protein OTU49_001374, partial [Cherax quadricarinatus]